MEHEAAGCGKSRGRCAGARGYGDMSPAQHWPFGAPPLLPSSALLRQQYPHPARPCPPPAAPHLNDSPTQPRHVRQLLKRLCVGVVVLSKLCLHDLGGEEKGRGGQDEAGELQPLRPPRPSPTTCSCSAVKEVRALLAGFGWLSCSEGTAPSSVIPLPTREKPRTPQVRNSPAHLPPPRATAAQAGDNAPDIVAWGTRSIPSCEQ